MQQNCRFVTVLVSVACMACNAGSAAQWSDPRVATAEPAALYALHLSMTPSGCGLLAWEQEGISSPEIWAARFDCTSGEIGPIRRIAQGSRGAFAAGDGGEAAVAYLGAEGGVWLIQQPGVDHDWDAPQRLFDWQVSGGEESSTTIAVDERGNVVAVRVVELGGADRQLVANHYDALTGLSGAGSTVDATAADHSPRVARHATAGAVGFYPKVSQGLVAHRYTPLEGTWSEGVVIGDAPITGLGYRLQATMDAEGGAVAAWCSQVEYGCQFTGLSYFDASTQQWEPPLELQPEERPFELEDCRMQPWRAGGDVLLICANWNDSDPMLYQIAVAPVHGKPGTIGEWTVFNAEEGEFVSHATFAVAPDGRVLALYQEQLASTIIQRTLALDTLEWSDGEVIGTYDAYASVLRARLSARGGAVVACSDNDAQPTSPAGLFASAREDQSGGWGEAHLGSVSADLVKVALDERGNAMVAWTECEQPSRCTVQWRRYSK